MVGVGVKFFRAHIIKHPSLQNPGYATAEQHQTELWMLSRYTVSSTVPLRHRVTPNRTTCASGNIQMLYFSFLGGYCGVSMCTPCTCIVGDVYSEHAKSISLPPFLLTLSLPPSLPPFSLLPLPLTLSHRYIPWTISIFVYKISWHCIFHTFVHAQQDY